MSTSQAARFEKVAQNIFRQAIKTFELKDLVRHRHIHDRSLLELVSRFPGGGQGFKVYRKTWPKGMYYNITHVNYKSSRFGNVFGILFQKNKQYDMFPKRLRGANKRGVWLYEFNSQRNIVLDNGLVYTAEELKQVVDRYRSPYLASIEAKKQAAESEQVAEGSATEAVEGAEGTPEKPAA